MSGRIDGKVVLISGAGGTKGLAIAQLMIKKGAKRVVVTDVIEDRVSGIAAQVDFPEKVTHFQMDAGKEEDWQRVINHIEQTEGRLDILINSARIIGVGMITEMPLEQWRSGTAANFDSTFLGAKIAIPLMIASGGGNIVNVVSIGALHPTDYTPNYSACNAAQLNLLQTIALQYSRQGIRANGVVVGFSDNSPMMDGADAFEVARRVMPLGRPCTGPDIARAVLWFASDDSSYATGTHVVLDGGWTLGLKF